MHIHSKSNIIPISDWTWIGAELELDWTWIVVSGLLHRKRNETMMWFSDEVFITTKKSFFAFFLSHCHIAWVSGCYAWQEDFSPVTLPSQGLMCVTGVWREKYAPVTRNALIYNKYDGVTGKSRKIFFVVMKKIIGNPNLFLACFSM